MVSDLRCAIWTCWRAVASVNEALNYSSWIVGIGVSSIHIKTVSVLTSLNEKNFVSADATSPYIHVIVNDFSLIWRIVAFIFASLPFILSRFSVIWLFSNKRKFRLVSIKYWSEKGSLILYSVTWQHVHAREFQSEKNCDVRFEMPSVIGDHDCVTRHI